MQRANNTPQGARSVFWFCLRFLTLVFLGTLAAKVAAATLLIDDSFDRVNLVEHAQRTVMDKNIAYPQVLAESADGTPFRPLSPLRPASRLWIYTQLQHVGANAVKLTLSVERPTLDNLTVLVLDERHRIIHSFTAHSEAMLPFEQLLPAINFTFSLEPQQQVTLMLTARDNGLMSFPVLLWERSALDGYITQHLILFGMLTGILGILFIYFFISYLYQRTPARFWLALANLLFLSIVVSNQGIVASGFRFVSYTEHIFAILIGLCLLTLVKITHNLFFRLPLILRLLNYIPPLVLLAVVALDDPYLITLATLATIPATGLLQALLAMFYRDRRNKALSRIFLISWLFLTALFALQLDIVANSYSLTSNHSLFSVIMLALASLSFGICVELRERNLNIQQISSREKTISNLNYFYNLFRNSAEGLYTSTVEGTLKSVNPAMCALFGYADEKAMLESVTDTKAFYAQGEDRDRLLGELLEKGSVMGREIRGRRADGTHFWFSISCQLHKEEGESFLFGSIFDITDKKQSDISLEYLATHDSLTGLLNRREFEQRLHSTTTHPAEEPVVLVYLDLDRFKVVNDTCGHKAGDALIKEVARLLQNTLNGQGSIARLGGDEFAVLFEGQSEDSVYACCEKMLDAVRSYRFLWENKTFTLGASIGMVNCSRQEVNPEQMLSMADAACYVAKEQGRNRIHRYSSDDESLKRYEQELEWVATIDQSLQQDRFVLFYQHYRPLNKPVDGDYYEILLRMKGENDELVPPNAFLPFAERYDLSARIDRWVVEKTFQWLHQHKDELASLKRCNINLSGHSMADRDLKLFILNAFEQYAIPYQKICFEITETMAIVKMDETLEFMSTFKQLGCLFALDDFGSGFSSYTYLKNLPVDCVKIDGSFIKDLLNDPVDLAMVSSIKDVARAMGMDTVGEFVENEATMVELGKMGVQYAQGFGVAHPAPLADFKPL